MLIYSRLSSPRHYLYTLRRLLSWAATAASLTACTGLQHGPIGFWSRNRYHRATEERHGPWREYFDKEERHLANRGSYRRGRPVGRWQTYSPSGAREHTEQFHRKPYGLVTIAYYHPNGRVSKRGQARYRAEPTGAHFFWFGEWQRFDAAGKALPSEWYENGHQVAPPGKSVGPELKEKAH